jgi:hypothetical protein
MFTSIGVNFMLLESKPIADADDFAILTLPNDLSVNEFIHSKLDKNMKKVI